MPQHQSPSPRQNHNRKHIEWYRQKRSIFIPWLEFLSIIGSLGSFKLRPQFEACNNSTSSFKVHQKHIGNASPLQKRNQINWSTNNKRAKPYSTQKNKRQVLRPPGQLHRRPDHHQGTDEGSGGEPGPATGKYQWDCASRCWARKDLTLRFKGYLSLVIVCSACDGAICDS